MRRVHPGQRPSTPSAHQGPGEGRQPSSAAALRPQIVVTDQDGVLGSARNSVGRLSPRNTVYHAWTVCRPADTAGGGGGASADEGEVSVAVTREPQSTHRNFAGGQCGTTTAQLGREPIESARSDASLRQAAPRVLPRGALLMGLLPLIHRSLSNQHLEDRHPSNRKFVREG